MKSRMRRAFGFATVEARESADTQALLTCAEKEEENQEARTEDKVSLGRKCLLGWQGAQRGKYWGQGLLEVFLGLLKTTFCVQSSRDPEYNGALLFPIWLGVVLFLLLKPFLPLSSSLVQVTHSQTYVLPK